MIFNTMTSKTFPKDARGNPAFNMVRIPGKTKNLSGATLGGFQLAVNKFTRNVNASVKAVQAMMTREFQVKRLEMTKVWPTIPSIYGDPVFCQMVPQCKVMETLQVAARPAAATSPNYLAASQRVERSFDFRGKSVRGTKIPQHSQVHQVTFVHFSDPAGIVFMTISGILAIANIVLFIVIFLNRTNRVLSAASPLFLLMMVAGTLIGHAAIYVYTGRPSSLKCVLQPWFVVGGYSVTVAALISRTWRIYQIFRNPYSMIQVTNPELLKTWVYLTALNIFLLVLWTFFNAPAPALPKHPNGWIMIGLLFTYNALMLGGAVFLTSRTRRVQGPFNEARYVGYAVYTMVLVDVILIMALLFNRVDRSHISHSVIKTQSFPACQIESMESARTTGKTHGGSARVLPPGVKAGANENGYTQGRC
ncbi:7 transmembrane sweet-taste receptor of 3 GCPR-domain-containing protein [Chytridium lagenaria]|nr:7 transmembrane sweet-taste receptor of 3 GCPR-domain-containing protein [Chytridium lagenaria]